MNNEATQPTQAEGEILPQSDGRNTAFTAGTPLSKMLALILFIALPFVGFWFGQQYGKFQSSDVQREPAVTQKESASVTRNENLDTEHSLKILLKNEQNNSEIFSFQPNTLEKNFPAIFVEDANYVLYVDNDGSFKEYNIEKNTIRTIAEKVISYSPDAFQYFEHTPEGFINLSASKRFALLGGQILIDTESGKQYFSLAYHLRLHPTKDTLLRYGNESGVDYSAHGLTQYDLSKLDPNKKSDLDDQSDAVTSDLAKELGYGISVSAARYIESGTQIEVELRPYYYPDSSGKSWPDVRVVVSEDLSKIYPSKEELLEQFRREIFECFPHGCG
jgi:hypothetical protein